MNKNLVGKRIWVHALGCRTNQYEAEALASMLAMEGAVITDDLDSGIDIAVIFSCTVTATADRKSRQLSRKIKRLFPESILVVCGCWAQHIDRATADSMGIDILVGSRGKSGIPDLLDDFLVHNGHTEIEPSEDIMVDHKWDPLFLERNQFHTRSFIKVQDGCNHFCSYCVIPYVRGYPVSRDPDDILREVEHIVASGCREVVLTGVHLGLFEKYGSLSLGDLVHRISEIEGLWRIRFGSLEPFAVTEDLLKVLADTPKFCRHLHLPLQSGDDEILQLMKRGYTGEEYLGILDKIRNFLGDDVHISTDILVGFPGESETAFSNTLSLLERADLGKLHIFPYSGRKGTPAFEMTGKIPHSVIDRRVHELLAFGEQCLVSYSNRWIGRPVSVLVEEGDGESFEGLTPEYIRVRTVGNAEVNMMAKVVPTGISKDGLTAVPLSGDMAEGNG